MLTQRVKFQDYGGTDHLICPRCGSEYLHHGEVERWDRPEDAKTVRYTRAAAEETETRTLGDDESVNPSSRRSGLVVSFECEGCGGGQPGNRIELCIAQHKGNTEIEWRFHPKPTTS